MLSRKEAPAILALRRGRRAHVRDSIVRPSEAEAQVVSNLGDEQPVHHKLQIGSNYQ
jgi:hypothetical protein